MSDQKPKAEPSMEEILASIRRIISDDSAAGGGVQAAGVGKVPASPPMDDDVLELTQMVPDDTLPAAAGWSPPPVTSQMPSRQIMEESLVSDAPASRATAHFAQMYGAAGMEKAWPMGNNIRTVEDVVKDLLRPMLKEWLDENLPPMVERLVQRELDRMSRRAGFE